MESSPLYLERLRRGWTQAHLADFSGVSRRTIQRAERGEAIGAVSIQLLCKCLDKSPADLGLIKDLERPDGTNQLGLSMIETMHDNHSIYETCSARTQHIAHILSKYAEQQLMYQPSKSLIDELHCFLSSTNRVFFLQGGLGTGKSSVCCHLAEYLPSNVMIQLHLAHQLNLGSTNFAASILRYAGIPERTEPSDDAVQQLEQLVTNSVNTWLIVVDGLSDARQFHQLGNELDQLLGYISHEQLRFLVTYRPLVASRLFEHPIVNASLFRPFPLDHSSGFSFCLERWAEDEAQEIWNTLEVAKLVNFSRFPQAVRHLLRLPLHMRLVAATQASASSPLFAKNFSSYELIDLCVRESITKAGGDFDSAFLAMQHLAEQLYDKQYLARSAVVTLSKDDVSGLEPAIVAGVVTSMPSLKEGEVILRFSHDIFAEYTFAHVIVTERMSEVDILGTIELLSQFVALADYSAIAEGVLEFIILALYSRFPQILFQVLRSPSANPDGLLAFAVRSVNRSELALPNDTLYHLMFIAVSSRGEKLARAIFQVSTLKDLDSTRLAQWFIEVVHVFRSRLWLDIVKLIKRLANDPGLVKALVRVINIEEPDEARLLAQIVPSVAAFEPTMVNNLLLRLRTYSQWQVRAALVGALAQEAAQSRLRGELLFYYENEQDYKVRTAIARTATSYANLDLVTRFFRDPNWHVRNAVLTQLLHAPREVLLEVLELIDESWASAPVEVRANLWTLRLLAGKAQEIPDTEKYACDKALFRLLRESSTSTRVLPHDIMQQLLQLGSLSTNWIVRREANRVALSDNEAKIHWLEAPADSAVFRRRRGGRSIQIALDCLDIERAISVAKLAKEGGADFLEVGDPLIKSQGVTAISKIKQAVPEMPIVAEMMSADWGQDQVELAAMHGADIVFLIGPASQVSVQRAVSMARRLGLILLLDVPLGASQEWCAAVQEAGTDGLVITTNIDIGSDTPSAQQRAAIIRRWSELPLAISGGFGPSDLPAMKNTECDIVIIGRSIVDAVDPKSAIESCVSAFKL